MDVAHIADELVAGLRVQLPAEVVLEGFEVEVGEHLEIDVDALLTALKLLVPGVEIRLVRVEGLLRCLECGAEYPADDVLGIGEDGTGQNLLGTILMALRAEMAE